MKGLIRFTVWIALSAILTGVCIFRKMHTHAGHPHKKNAIGIDSIREAAFGLNRVLIRFA
jgi:hypothetical protein